MTEHGRPPSDWYGGLERKRLFGKAGSSVFPLSQLFDGRGRRGGGHIGKVGLAEYLTGGGHAFPLLFMAATVLVDKECLVLRLLHLF